MASKAKKKKSIEELDQVLENEHRIRKAFKDKDWAEIKKFRLMDDLQSDERVCRRV
jgi:hypothetical protein